MSLFLQNHFLHTWPLQATLRILDLLTREVFFFAYKARYVLKYSIVCVCLQTNIS